MFWASWMSIMRLLVTKRALCSEKEMDALLWQMKVKRSIPFSLQYDYSFFSQQRMG